MDIKTIKNDIDALDGWKHINHIPDEFITPQKMDNFLLALKEEKEGVLKCKSMPYHLVVEPTNICNLNCALCSTGQGPTNRKKGSMKLDGFKQLVDSVKDFALEIYLQNWGEPTLIQTLPDMISYAAQAGIWTNVSSNFSQKYKEGYLERLMTSGLAVLHIDIDGTTQEVYEKYRVKGKLNLVSRKYKRSRSN